MQKIIKKSPSYYTIIQGALLFSTLDLFCVGRKFIFLTSSLVVHFTPSRDFPLEEIPDSRGQSSIANIVFTSARLAQFSAENTRQYQ